MPPVHTSPYFFQNSFIASVQIETSRSDDRLRININLIRLDIIRPALIPDENAPSSTRRIQRNDRSHNDGIICEPGGKRAWISFRHEHTQICGARRRQQLEIKQIRRAGVIFKRHTDWYLGLLSDCEGEVVVCGWTVEALELEAESVGLVLTGVEEGSRCRGPGTYHRSEEGKKD